MRLYSVNESSTAKPRIRGVPRCRPFATWLRAMAGRPSEYRTVGGVGHPGMLQKMVGCMVEAGRVSASGALAKVLRVVHQVRKGASVRTWNQLWS